ncbi:hypothetical protein [Pseudodesulfovibrio sp.]|uniref:hypothetical protein n=1 Tax=unclassified Pseudodesulfovibrio TaxID=2661612 RepID=UPI003B002120
MDTEFRVMPVRTGESYLLRSQRGVYLMDGGGFGCGLPDMLRERGVRKIRAAVCSSLSMEKGGGILDAMRSSIPISELWLPEEVSVLPELATHYNGDLSGWLDVAATKIVPPAGPRPVWPTISSSLSRRWRAVCALYALAVAAGLGTWQDVLPKLYGKGWTPYFLQIIRLMNADSEDKSAQITDITSSLFGSLNEMELALICGRMILNRFEPSSNKDNGTAQVIVPLVMSAMLFALAEEKGIRLRLFRRVDRQAGGLVSRHPLRCLNGVEADPLPTLLTTTQPKTLFSQAIGLAHDGNGLVFQYGDAECGALFLSDSRLEFLGKENKLHLDRPTVITAPGQGSCRQEAAYKRIAAIRPADNVWVRARLPRHKKVASAFTRQPHTVCLQNCRNGVLREIMLLFHNGKWQQAEDACGCV